MQLIRRLKNHFVKRMPRAVAAYHALRARETGGSFKLQRTNDGFLFAGPDVMQSGAYEEGETQFIRRMLEQRPVFVDVGANAGYFVCLAKAVGSHVVAVEPSTNNLALLYMNIAANGWRDVEVFPVGLSSESQVATLYGSGTAASLLTRWAGTSEVLKQTVPLSTLDIILGDRFGDRQLLIKVDVEGAEFDVLRGATSVLQRMPRPIWVAEVCLTENHATGINPHFRAVFDSFWNAGYEARPVNALEREVTEADVTRWLGNGRRDFGYVGYVFADRDVFAALTHGTEQAAAS